MDNKIKEELMALMPKNSWEVAEEKVLFGECTTGFYSNYDQSIGICCTKCKTIKLFPLSEVKLFSPPNPHVYAFVEYYAECPVCKATIKSKKRLFSSRNYHNQTVFRYSECIPRDGAFYNCAATYNFWDNKVEYRFERILPTSFYETIESSPGYYYYNSFESNYAKTKDLILDELRRLFPYSGVRELAHSFGGYWHDTLEIKYLLLYTKYPFIEQLVKAGYTEQVTALLNPKSAKSNFSMFERCFKNGKSIKEIVRMPESFAKLIKNASLKEFNNWRIFINKYYPSLESFKKILEFSFDAGQVDLLKQILSYGYYEVDTLINYLERCDMFQAIRPEDALLLIRDYHKMAKDMGVEPNTRSNSLKREHDVMARNYVVSISEEDQAAFAKKVPLFKELEYEGKDFIVIAPERASDIIMEGKNQNNCVGSYLSLVINGDETIMFMRRKHNPLKSYVTISINRETLELKQAYERCNHSIRDFAAKEFLYEWMEYLKQRKLSEVAA